MASVRIEGVNLPNKPVFVSLSYLYGIGKSVGKEICEDLKINHTRRMHDLSEEEVAKIRSHIAKRAILVEGNLRSQVTENIKELIRIGCYRGIRHRLGLPVNGQRTKTNARTRKGKRKVVANKKKVAK